MVPDPVDASAGCAGSLRNRFVASDANSIRPCAASSRPPWMRGGACLRCAHTSPP